MHMLSPKMWQFSEQHVLMIFNEHYKLRIYIYIYTNTTHTYTVDHSIKRKKNIQYQMANANQPTNSWSSFYERFQYDETRDSAGEVRNALLVISALIVAVTFQAGVNPPGGVWQDDDAMRGHITGTAIYSANIGSYTSFLMFNTLALSSCLFVILCLTRKFPFYIEICLASFSMAATYVSAVFAVTPRDAVKFRFLLLAAFSPIVVRFVKCLLEKE